MYDLGLQRLRIKKSKFILIFCLTSKKFNPRWNDKHILEACNYLSEYF